MMYIRNEGDTMLKDTLNKVIMSMLINFMWVTLILLIDYVSAMDVFYGLLLEYEYEVKCVILSLVLCSQGGICAYLQCDNTRKNIIFTVVSFACVMLVYGYFIF